MRKTLLVLVLAVVVIWMFQHPDELQRYTGKASRIAGDYLTGVADKWSPKPEKPPEFLAPLEPPPPEGVYYLRQPLRLSSPGGPIVVGTGSAVRKTGEGEGRIMVTDGVGQAVVDESLITRDPVEIRQLKHNLVISTSAKDSLEKAQLPGRIRDLDAKLASLRAEIEAVRKRELAALQSGRATGMTTSGDFLQNEIKRLEQQKAALLHQTPGSATPTAPAQAVPAAPPR